MEIIYQNKWTSQFASKQAVELSKNEWGEALYELTGEQINRGLAKCRAEFKWPPSIAEFLQAAKVEDNPEHQGAAYRAFKPLSKPESTPEVKKAAMKEIKGIFSKKISLT